MTLQKKEDGSRGKCAIIVATIGTIGALSWLNLQDTSPKRLIFDGKLNNAQVTYWDGHEPWWNTRTIADTLKIAEVTGFAYKMEDWDEDGTIGNHENDRFSIIQPDGSRETFTKDFFIDKNRMRYSAKSTDLLERRIAEASSKKLEEGNNLYQSTIAKIVSTLKRESGN